MVTAVKVAALFGITIAATTATATPIADAHGALITVTLTIRHAAVTSGVYGWMSVSLRCRTGIAEGWWCVGPGAEAMTRNARLDGNGIRGRAVVILVHRPTRP